MPRRRFTPAQANRTLPLVRRVVADILGLGQQLKRLSDGAHPPGAREVAPRLQAELAELYEELQRIGCSYKDWGFDLGLVDFPAEIEGRDVLLCWRSDEPRLEWYHTPSAGFAGRTPIPAELLEPADPARP